MVIQASVGGGFSRSPPDNPAFCPYHNPIHLQTIEVIALEEKTASILCSGDS